MEHSKIIRKNYMKLLYSILLIMLLLSFCGGGEDDIDTLREIPLSVDEKALREEFKIPETVKTISIERNIKKSGTFGREGLRVFGKFQLDKSALQFYQNSPRWYQVPVPGKISKFHRPPEELPKLKNGIYFCHVWVYQNNGMYDSSKSETTDCRDPSVKTESPGNVSTFNFYGISIIDLDTLTLYALRQNYY